jgi:hypothetical protein
VSGSLSTVIVAVTVLVDVLITLTVPQGFRGGLAGAALVT